MIVLLISIALAIIGLLTVGLPGAVVLQVAESLAGIVSSAQLGNDQAWPAALLVSALGPFTLIPAHLVSRRARLPCWQHAVLAGILAFVLTVAATIVGIILSGR